MKNFNNIYFCGFMGCGKTTIGQKLALRLDCDYADLDKVIVLKANMSIPDIFKNFGEKYFRDLETDCLNELSKKDSTIISTGGGAFMKEENINICKASGSIVYLNLSFEDCYTRIKNDSNRPIVMEKTKEELKNLYNMRAMIYKNNCDFEVDAKSSPTKICEKIQSHYFGG
jgi:shikimate kinase